MHNKNDVIAIGSILTFFCISFLPASALPFKKAPNSFQSYLNTNTKKRVIAVHPFDNDLHFPSFQNLGNCVYEKFPEYNSERYKCNSGLIIYTSLRGRLYCSLNFIQYSRLISERDPSSPYLLSTRNDCVWRWTSLLVCFQGRQYSGDQLPCDLDNLLKGSTTYPQSHPHLHATASASLTILVIVARASPVCSLIDL